MKPIRFRSLFIRYRIAVQGLCIAFAVAIGSLYFAYKVDIFPNEGPIAVHEASIELDEALLVAALTLIAVFIFGLSQYIAQSARCALESPPSNTRVNSRIRMD